jgi:hypothetical protein
MTNIIHLKEHRPGASSDTDSAPSSMTKKPPGLGSPPESELGLEQRIHVRRAELIAKLTEHRASVQLDEAGAGDKVKARLSELAHIMREGVVDGWANIGDGVTQRLERWLAESAQHLAPPEADLIAIGSDKVLSSDTAPPLAVEPGQD